MFRSKLFPRHLRRRQVGKRMADKLRPKAAFAIEALLEREDDQHLANVFPHLLDAALLPRPELRADIVNDGHAELVELARQAQVEFGEVDEHRGVWPSPFGLAHHFAEAAIDERNVPDDLDNADFGNLSRIHQKVATGGAHLVSANAEELQLERRSLVRELAAQSFHQLRAIKFAGGLSRGDEDTHTGIMTGQRCQL